MHLISCKFIAARPAKGPCFAAYVGQGDVFVGQGLQVGEASTPAVVLRFDPQPQQATIWRIVGHAVWVVNSFASSQVLGPFGYLMLALFVRSRYQKGNVLFFLTPYYQPSVRKAHSLVGKDICAATQSS